MAKKRSKGGKKSGLAKGAKKKTAAVRAKAVKQVKKLALKGTPKKSAGKKTSRKLSVPKKATPVVRKAAKKKAAPTRSPAKKGAAAKRAAAKKAAPTRSPAKKKSPAKLPKKTSPAAPLAAKKTSAKVPTVLPTKSGPKKASILRRDGAGHLNPKYAADLLRQSGKASEDDVAFLGKARAIDDLAESLGEQFVAAATTGEDDAEEFQAQEVPEERGGPFVPSTAGAEFADGTDPSNPPGAKREPFPTT